MEKVEFLGKPTWVLRSDTPSPLFKVAHTVLLNAFGVKETIPIFPGPQPVSIERRHIHLLHENPYYVCEKTDGTRYAILSFMFQEKKYCFVVNRNLEFFSVNFKIPTNVVLDGELVQCFDNKWKFMVYDAALSENPKANLGERLDVARGVVNKIIKLASHPFTMEVKEFWKMSQFQDFQKKQFPYHVDGIVFTPCLDPIKIGTHERMFKWKPLIQNTIDFQVKWRPHQNMWGLYCQERGLLVLESALTTEQALECGIPFEDGIIVECMYNEPLWKPIKQRGDKNYPNSRKTFWRTMINLRENIQPLEFL